MITKKLFFSVVCNCCGKYYIDEHWAHSAWITAEIARNKAFEAHWIDEEGNDYCPDCYSFDDDDKLVIKPYTIKLKGQGDDTISSEHKMVAKYVIMEVRRLRYLIFNANQMYIDFTTNFDRATVFNDKETALDIMNRNAELLKSDTLTTREFFEYQ